MPSEQQFVTSYFGDDVKIGKLVYSMLQQKPEKRPEMEHVLVQMVEIKVRQELNLIMTKKAEQSKFKDDLDSAVKNLEHVEEENKPLPPGWEKRTDKLGRPFYIDHKMRKTQWNPPVVIRNTGKVGQKEVSKYIK